MSSGHTASNYNWTDYIRCESVIQFISNQGIYTDLITGIPHDARKVKIYNLQYDAADNTLLGFMTVLIPSLNLVIPLSIYNGTGSTTVPITLLLTSPFPTPLQFQIIAYNNVTGQLSPTTNVTGMLSFTLEISRDEDSRRLCHGIRNTPH